MWSVREWRLARSYVRRMRMFDKALEVPIVKYAVNGRDSPVRAWLRFKDGEVTISIYGASDYIVLRNGEEAFVEAHTGNVGSPLQFTLAVTRRSYP